MASVSWRILENWVETDGIFGCFFSVPDEAQEEAKPRTAPTFVSHPDSTQVEEGEWARFCCRVTGYPKPRVMWLINGHTVVNVSKKVIFTAK